MFWRIIKSFFFDKLKSEEAISFVNKENIELNEIEVEKLLRGFFSNDVKNLKIPEYQCEDNLHKRLPNYQALQAIISITI